MSNKKMTENERNAVEILRLALKKHQGKAKNVNDFKDMRDAIALAEELRREDNPNFRHFPDATYKLLGLSPPPKTKIDIKPLKQSSEEYFSDDTQSESSPRKKQPLPEIQEDEDYGLTVDVEDLPAENSEVKMPENNKSSHNSLVQQGVARAAKTNKPAPTSVPAKPAPVVNNSVKNMGLLLTGIAKIDPKYKTAAMTNAILLANEEYRTDPSKAFQTIIDQFGQERKKMGKAARAESGFFKALMKINTLTIVIEDPKCRAVLENKINSLIPEQKKAVEKLLNATKDTVPTPQKK